MIDATNAADSIGPLEGQKTRERGLRGGFAPPKRPEYSRRRYGEGDAPARRCNVTAIERPNPVAPARRARFDDLSMNKPTAPHDVEQQDQEFDPGAYIGHEPEFAAETIPGGVQPKDERVSALDTRSTGVGALDKR